MSSYEPTGDPPDRSDTGVVGERVGAQIVDLVLMAVQLGVVVLVLGSGTGAFLLGLLTLPLYGGLQEGYWDGQTVGKKVFGIRVVSERGGDCSVGQAFARNAPALAIPGWLAYLVALLSMAASDYRQRLFDRVAGTVVVSS